MAVEGLTEVVAAAVVVVVLGGASGLTPALRGGRAGGGSGGSSHGHKIPVAERAPTPMAAGPGVRHESAAFPDACAHRSAH
ncbi:hypothetical protein GCM10009721_25980 [Terrabacter tumescens]|uniref:Secreted protein n=1 Tax=Terrabacter tumescens TaxID=60443 RepID=A0ABQ2I3S4_9MICO|nr:hypothetical protein GCM10009721_25980 [Terrabacter tumescens]